MRQGRKLFLCSSAGFLALSLAGCPIQPTENADNPEPEPQFEFSMSEEDVLEARGRYRVSLIGLEVIEDGAAGEAVAGEAASAAVEAAAMVVAAEAEDEAWEEGEEDLEGGPHEGPRSTEVLLDLIVRFVGPGKPLPGITVEVSHSDPYGQVKAQIPTWVETPKFRRGEKRQVPVRLGVPDYESGDEFYVEFSEFVPPEKRGDYREFSAAAP